MIFKENKKVKKEIGLFAHREDWQNNAMVNWSADKELGYIIGYRRAAELLITHVSERNSDQDTLIYPIVFLYRHYLEIVLKEILWKGSMLIGDPLEPDCHHKLKDLWSKTRDLLAQLSDEGNLKGFDQIDVIVKEISLVDPNSTSFRYAKTTRGKSSLSELSVINVSNFGEQMHEAGELLDGALGFIENLLSELQQNE